MQTEYKFKQKYNTNSNRLQNYDYSSNWGYFITICTKNKENYFGEIIDWKMVFDEIIQTPKMRKNVILDEFVVMPNHIHLILIIISGEFNSALNSHCTKCHVETHCTKYHVETHCTKYHVETHCNVSLQQKNKFWPQKNNLGSIIRWLKWWIKNKINTKYWNKIFFAWQPNYYDRIIRNEYELQRIRKYIIENPLKRELDKNNIENIFM